MDMPLEQSFLELVDIKEGWQLIERFSTLVRESGTEDESKAARYIVDRLGSYGIPVTVYEPELFISLPRAAQLLIETPKGQFEIRCKASSFSLSTGGESLEAELSYYPASEIRGVDDLFHTHLQSEIPDLEGKVVVTEGFAMPTVVRTLEGLGAVAQIYINPGRNIHEGICTGIWGNPTTSNLYRKPSTPVVCVNRSDGDRLLSECQSGTVIARISTRLDEGWRRCLLPVATISGQDEPEFFLLVHGHYDSWHVGIGDNATGNATLLELARIFHQGRKQLKRSLKIAWWPGHSTGRYAGSTWYADQFALELNKYCLAQVNIDSPGCREATSFQEVMWMEECARLCKDSIHDRTGQQIERIRPLRAGDYSFNQIGLSSFFMLLSNRSPQDRKRLGFYPVGGCGGDIAWHTEDDTLQIADPAILRKDLEIYTTAVVRVLNAEILPFDFRAALDEMRRGVEDLVRSCQSFSLVEILESLDSLDLELQDFYRYLEGRSSNGDDNRINRILVELGRRLVPVNYARGERFDHDPAEPLGVIPKLDGVGRLAELDEDSDEWRFLATELVRQRNKVANQLYETSRYLSDQRQLLGY